MPVGLSKAQFAGEDCLSGELNIVAGLKVAGSSVEHKGCHYRVSEKSGTNGNVAQNPAKQKMVPERNV